MGSSLARVTCEISQVGLLVDRWFFLGILGLKISEIILLGHKTQIKIQKQTITVKNLKNWSPEKLAVVILKFDTSGFSKL